MYRFWLQMRTCVQNVFFRCGAPPPSVYLDRHQRLIHMIKWTRHTARDQKLDSGKSWNEASQNIQFDLDYLQPHLTYFD